MTAAAFVLTGTFCDIGTWYYARDVKIFDDDEDELEEIDKEVDVKLQNLEIGKTLKNEKSSDK